MTSKTNYNLSGIVLAGCFVLAAVVLPICQTYMMDHASMAHTEQAQCCGADESNSDLVAAHHIAYFKTMYTGLASKGTFALLLGLAALFLLSAFLVWSRKDFSHVFQRLQYYSKIPEVPLWNFLQVAYAQGIVQSKHLD